MSEELILLRNRFLFALGVAIAFAVPSIIFVINKFGDQPSKILKMINNEETMVLLITEDGCKKCSNIENVLKEYEVNYTLLNKDKELKYEEILHKINIPKSDVEPPTIIYVEEGKLHSSLVSANKEELLSYISINELDNSK